MKMMPTESFSRIEEIIDSSIIAASKELGLDHNKVVVAVSPCDIKWKYDITIRYEDMVSRRFSVNTYDLIYDPDQAALDVLYYVKEFLEEVKKQKLILTLASVEE